MMAVTRYLAQALALLVLPSFSFYAGDHRILSNEGLEPQVSLVQGEEFISRGITGKGITIAVIDAGFKGTDTHPGLAHLFRNGQIAGTWDFIRNQEDVFAGHSHGTAVLSCIAGIHEGKQLGLAPDARFLLARTERRNEPAREEADWAKAVDWAIRNGADIIQSSIGFTYHRYFPEEMNGRYSLAARAALRAARAGVLLVNSAGNEGRTRWKIVTTPADADSILCVGAISPLTGLAERYSSLGPAADGRIKPNVCASGRVIAFTAGGKARAMDGTSFASPMISGFAACLMQLLPGATAQEILERIERSGHLYPYYDYSHGYGVPQASRFFHATEREIPCRLVIDTLNQAFEIETGNPCDLPARNLWSRYLYYHISDSSGLLVKYGVKEMNPLIRTSIARGSWNRSNILQVFYNGMTAQWTE